jgi:hypothetical protein
VNRLGQEQISPSLSMSSAVNDRGESSRENNLWTEAMDARCRDCARSVGTRHTGGMG